MFTGSIQENGVFINSVQNIHTAMKRLPPSLDFMLYLCMHTTVQWSRLFLILIFI